MGLGLEHGGQALCSLTDLTRILGLSLQDLAKRLLVPDICVVSVPGPLVVGPPTWPLFAPGPPPGPPPGSLFAYGLGKVQVQ